jgi:hypothetical protein
MLNVAMQMCCEAEYYKNEVKTPDTSSEKQAKTCDPCQTLPGKESLEIYAKISKKPEIESEITPSAELDTKNVDFHARDIFTPKIQIFTETGNVISVDHDPKKVKAHMDSIPGSFFQIPDAKEKHRQWASARNLDVILTDKKEVELTPESVSLTGNFENLDSDKKSCDSLTAVLDTKNSDKKSCDSLTAVLDTKNSDKKSCDSLTAVLDTKNSDNNISASMPASVKRSDSEEIINTEDSIEPNTSKVELEAKKGSKNAKLENLEIPCSKPTSLMKRADNFDTQKIENVTNAKLVQLDFEKMDLQIPCSKPTSLMKRADNFDTQKIETVTNA